MTMEQAIKEKCDMEERVTALNRLIKKAVRERKEAQARGRFALRMMAELAVRQAADVIDGKVTLSDVGLVSGARS